MKFENFTADMGNSFREDLEIDRKDTNGNYEPGNCHWVSRKFNTRNRRSNRFLEINGVRKTVSAWAEDSGINKATILSRLKKGRPLDRLFEPVKNLTSRNPDAIEINGEKHTVSEWSRRAGIKASTIWKRMARGWPAERLLEPIAAVDALLEGGPQ